MSSRLINLFLFALTSLVLQVWLGQSTNLVPDFALVTLVVLAFFAKFHEIFLFSSIYFLVLSSRPVPGEELWLILLAPAVILFIRTYSPWQSWISNQLANFLVLMTNYFLVLSNNLERMWALDFIGLIVINLVFAGSTFYILRYMAGYSSQKTSWQGY